MEGNSGMDGIAVAKDGDLLISQWESAGVIKGNMEDGFKEVYSGLDNPGDIQVDTKRNFLIVPQLYSHQVVFIDMNAENDDSVDCPVIDDKTKCNASKFCKWRKKKCTVKYKKVNCNTLDNKKDCRAKENKLSGCIWNKGSKKCTSSCGDLDTKETCQTAKDEGLCLQDNDLGKLFQSVCKQTCELCE